MAPRLEVTDEILERVVYGMENQKDRLLLDPADGLLKAKTDDDRLLVPLPPWGSTEGYRLMDSFAGTLPNAIFARRLRDILESGHGVFRRFKDALAERPEMEKLWRRYKAREMKKTALIWLSRWSEALDLENLGPEPEDWDELSATDFSIRTAIFDDIGRLKSWDLAALTERFGKAHRGEMEFQTRQERHGAEISEEDVLVAESPMGELVGFAWIHESGFEHYREAVLLQIYVIPEFRGLGLGRSLAEKAFEKAKAEGASRLAVAVPGSGRLLESWLEREGFQPELTVWKSNA